MIDFPSSPADGQQYTHDSRAWEWSAAKNAWLLVPVSSTDAAFAATQAAAANASAVAAAASEDAAAESETAASAAQSGAATSATLANDWATKTSAEVVAGQGYGAKKYAIDAAASAAEAATGVLEKVLAGLSLASGAAVTAADTVLSAFGKLQKQITDAVASIALKAPSANPTFTGTVSGVTKAHVGLGSVDNTADAAKPVSTAQQTALDLKAPMASPTFTGTVSGVTAAMVGLGNVDNTSDAAKPVSTAQAAAIATSKTTLESNLQTGTAYTLVLADAGKRVDMANTAANVVTVPLDSAVAFPIDTTIFVSQGDVGATSIAADSGVTINTAEGLKVGGQYKMVSLVKTATDTWMAIGTVA